MNKEFLNHWVCKLLFCGLVTISFQTCQQAPNKSKTPLPVDKLKAYVAKVGPDFSYAIKDTIHYPGADVYHIKMYSGRTFVKFEFQIFNLM